jgi:hypothetical protein
VYVPVSADVVVGFLFSELSGAYSLLLDSIDVSVAGKSSLTLERLLGCRRDWGTKGYCCGIWRTLPATVGGTKLKDPCCCVAWEDVEYAEELSLRVVAMLP